MSAPFQRHSATSRQAAASVVERVPSWRERVLAPFLTSRGRLVGFTDEELIDLLDLPANSVRPRRIDLTAAGVLQGAETRINKSGRPAVVWRLKTASLFDTESEVEQ